MSRLKRSLYVGQMDGTSKTSPRGSMESDFFELKRPTSTVQSGLKRSNAMEGMNRFSRTISTMSDSSGSDMFAPKGTSQCHKVQTTSSGCQSLRTHTRKVTLNQTTLQELLNVDGKDTNIDSMRNEQWKCKVANECHDYNKNPFLVTLESRKRRVEAALVGAVKQRAEPVSLNAATLLSSSIAKAGGSKRRHSVAAKTA